MHRWGHSDANSDSPPIANPNAHAALDISSDRLPGLLPPSLVNGGFENGPSCWTEFSQYSWTLILVSSNLPVPPHAGSWATWLGGDHDEIAYVEQQVTVPNGSPYLAYWHWINSEDACGFDFGGVLINGTVVDVYDLCSSQNTAGWVKHVVNLSSYQG